MKLEISEAKKFKTQNLRSKIWNLQINICVKKHNKVKQEVHDSTLKSNLMKKCNREIRHKIFKTGKLKTESLQFKTCEIKPN